MLSGDKENLVDIRLRLLGGDEVNHLVFGTTWLGYGTNQARFVSKPIDALIDFDGGYCRSSQALR
jgi:Golgi apyrase